MPLPTFDAKHAPALSDTDRRIAADICNEDEAAFAALLAEAREEADEAGLTDLASDLDAFVRLTA